MIDRAKAIESRSNSLKAYLLDNMQRLNIKEISCPQFKITIRKPQKIVSLVSDIDAIPAEYKKSVTTESVDKMAIKKALKAGELVSGAELIDGKTSLIIK